MVLFLAVSACIVYTCDTCDDLADTMYMSFIWSLTMATTYGNIICIDSLQVSLAYITSMPKSLCCSLSMNVALPAPPALPLKCPCLSLPCISKPKLRWSFKAAGGVRSPLSYVCMYILQ